MSNRFGPIQYILVPVREFIGWSHPWCFSEVLCERTGSAGRVGRKRQMKWSWWKGGGSGWEQRNKGQGTADMRSQGCKVSFRRGLLSPHPGLCVEKRRMVSSELQKDYSKNQQNLQAWEREESKCEKYRIPRCFTFWGHTSRKSDLVFKSNI